MKNIIITTTAAVLLVGCGKPQKPPASEGQSVEPVAEVQLADPVVEAPAPPPPPAVEASQSEPPPVKLEAPDMPVHEAIKEGDIQTVMQHLNAGTDVNTKDERGETAIFSAVVGGYNEIIKILIKKGADVGVKNKAGFTPLHEGAYSCLLYTSPSPRDRG